jgi:hypothetical protein
MMLFSIVFFPMPLVRAHHPSPSLSLPPSAGKGSACIKGIGNKNEIKKFMTLERIAEQVSFFYQMFFMLPPITGSNLGSIRKTRLDQVTV